MMRGRRPEGGLSTHRKQRVQRSCGRPRLGVLEKRGGSAGGAKGEDGRDTSQEGAVGQGDPSAMRSLDSL